MPNRRRRATLALCAYGENVLLFFIEILVNFILLLAQTSASDAGTNCQ